MPIPRKVVLFRDETHLYPVDPAGTVWHMWGSWGPLCEIQFAGEGEQPPEHPELVFQDMPDYIGGLCKDLGYDMWQDLRTRESWSHVPEEHTGLVFFARRFGLKLENPHHRVVASLLTDLIEHKIVDTLPEAEVAALVQRWLEKVGAAVEG